MTTLPPISGLRFFILGGLSEIGMNCSAVETEGRILVLDCGVMFSSEGLGIELIHPAFDYLVANRNRIEAVLLTHAHEDHIGAIPYLLRAIDVPVYGTSYTLGLVAERLLELPPPGHFNGNLMRSDVPISLGPFTVTPISMPHSVVQNIGLYIETAAGSILHTGDFKIGHYASIDESPTLLKIAELSKRGIDLMLIDSTGSEEDQASGTEASVATSLEALMAEATGRLYVALFSSNIERAQAVVQAAKRQGRTVAFCGRSVQSHLKIATNLGLFRPPAGTVISLAEAMTVPPNQSVIVVSGTQGEKRSALGRLADGNHNVLRIDANDTIVFSSRFIPGNELAIGKVIDKLLRLGARVIHRDLQTDIHVSGHASIPEITATIRAAAPRCLIPVHGTYRHLCACAALARGAGVPHVHLATNGDAIDCDAAGLVPHRQAIPVRKIYIGKSGGTLEDAEIKDRRFLGGSGAVFVAITLSTQGALLTAPDITEKGVVAENTFPWFADQLHKRIAFVLAEATAQESFDAREFQTSLCHSLRRFISKNFGQEPCVIVSVQTV